MSSQLGFSLIPDNGSQHYLWLTESMLRVLQHKLFWLTALVSAAIAVYCSPLLRSQTHLTHHFHAEWGVMLFISAHVVATVVGLPGTLLVIIGGGVFGLWWGTV
ncbi:MAG: hypothetical protein AAF289_00990, partial [Cyanobacteria bacterium P01_A01_bin.135]